MKVVLAGSRKLPAGTAPRALLHFLLRLPPDCVVLLRGPLSGHSGGFETDVEMLCRMLAIDCEFRRPNTVSTPGRASVFARDIEMVAEADLVMVFLSAEDAESGYSGTYHLFEKALDDQRPVYGWLADENGTSRWGEFDPDHLYVDLVS